MLKLQGIFASAATPFDHRGEIYKTKIRHNVEKWNRVKLTGYLVGGSAGEGALLTGEERSEVWRLVAEAAAPERVLLAGVSRAGVHETVALANHAAALGYRAAVAAPPNAYPHLLRQPAAQELYFRSVADQSKIPVIVDHAPHLTGIELPLETVLRLAAHPNIAAVRESGDTSRVAAILAGAPKGFQVLSGAASSLWPALDAGAGGAILGFASAAPYACITIWEAHRMREREAALDWQTRIAHPAELVTGKYGIPGLKHAMDLNGFYGGPARLPLPPLTPAARAEIEAAFDGIRG